MDWRARMKIGTCYIAARMREASTWQALILLLTALGAQFTPEQRQAILTFGLGIAGLLGAVFPDRIGAPQTRITDPQTTKPDEGPKS